MKIKSFVGIALLLFSQTAPAATEAFLGESSGTDGQLISVPVQFFTNEEIVGVQFDVSEVAGAVGNVTPGFDFNFTDHQIETELLASGNLRVLISSQNSEELYSGNLARIAVDLSADVPVNSRAIALSNVVFATRDGLKAALEVVPHLTVTSPIRGLDSIPGTEIQISAESAATTAGSAIDYVEFFANGVSIGFAGTPPYTTAWTPAEAGNYAITAVAVSSAGGERTSAAVPIFIGVSSGFEGWQMANFDTIQLQDPNISGPAANPDGDSLNNAGEFGFGGLPLIRDGSQVLGKDVIDQDTGDRFMSFSYWRSIFADSSDFGIEQSEDLIGWSPAGASLTEILVVPYGSLERVTILDTVPLGEGLPKKMLRARFEGP